MFLYQREYRAATWVHDASACAEGKGGASGGVPPCWTLQDDPAGEDGVPPTVPWISVDPAAPDLTAFPLYVHASPVSVTLSPGDSLYLPALWYHRVATEAEEDGGDGVSVAVNSWFNMSFMSGGWTSYQLAVGLAKALQAV
jgi:hypothetical protein